MSYPISLTPAQERFLADLFPGDGLILSAEGRTPFGADAGRRFALPLAVVRPGRVEQIVELLAWAEAERMPIYPRARGTGMVGGAVTVHGGVVVSMLKLDRILELDPEDFVARVEPGVITAHLQAEAARRKLFYPPDPASLRISTVGGNAATCAGGMRALKYGVTLDYVLVVVAVLPGGRTIRAGGRVHKDVVGLDLTRLFVGSAGTLGLMVELTLKLLPLPEAAASVLAAFDTLESALAAAASVLRAGLLPTALEFMDGSCLAAVAREGHAPWSGRPGGALLARLDGPAATLDVELGRLAGLLAESGPAALLTGRGAEEEALWELRRRVSPSAFVYGPDKLGEDVVVPRGKTDQAVAGFQAIGERLGLVVLCYGHLGDGNVHVNIMHDAKIPGQREAAAQAKEEVFRLALSLAGSISGEHGTGLSKAPYVAWQVGQAERELMARIKAVFDPRGIMNPGKGW